MEGNGQSHTLATTGRTQLLNARGVYLKMTPKGHYSSAASQTGYEDVAQAVPIL